MKLLFLRLILLPGFYYMITVSGYEKHRTSLGELSSTSKGKPFYITQKKNLQNGNRKSSPRSVTYISTYTLPVIWSAYHAKKLRDKLRKSKSNSYISDHPSQIIDETKIQSPDEKLNADIFPSSTKSYFDFADWKDIYNKDKQTQLPLEKIFVQTKSEKENLPDVQKQLTNSTLTELLENVHDNIPKILKNRKKRKHSGKQDVIPAMNEKSFKNNSLSVTSVNKSTGNNTSSIALLLDSADVAVSRSISIIQAFLLKKAIFFPAVILEFVLIFGLVFLSPVFLPLVIVLAVIAAILCGCAFIWIL